MSALTINGVDVPVASWQELPPLRLGALGRGTSGRMDSTARKEKRRWKGETIPLSRADAEAFRRLFGRRGHVWNFASLYASTGLGPSSSSGATVGTSGLFAGNLALAANGHLAYALAGSDTYLSLSGVSGVYASTPDSVANSITGDIDIRAKVAPDSWTPAASQVLVAKEEGPPNRSWSFYLDGASGKLAFYHSVDGSAFTAVCVSTVAAGGTAGVAKWTRVTRTSATGVVRFYTSTDGATWSQLGADVAGTSGAIFDSAAAVTIGARGAGTVERLAGKVHRAEVRNGIDGAPAAVFNAEDYPTSGTTIVATTGETWTLNGAATITRAGTQPWTLLVWRFESSRWVHYAIRDDGTRWKGGVSSTAGASWLLTTTSEARLLSISGSSQTYSDMVYLPYRIPSSWAASIFARHSKAPWSSLPKADAYGDGLNGSREPQTNLIINSDTFANGGNTTVGTTHTNICLRSEEFDNATWSKGDATATANTVANPLDGAVTADKLVEAATTADHYVVQGLTLTDSTSYTASVYAKAAGRTLMRIHVRTKAGGFPLAVFDLTNGVITSSSGSALVASRIESIGSGWYRCSITANAETGGTAPHVAIFPISSGTTTNYLGDGSSGIHLFGAQVETGIGASEYIATTTASASLAVMGPNGTRVAYRVNVTAGAISSSNVNKVLVPAANGASNYGASIWARAVSGTHAFGLGVHDGSGFNGSLVTTGVITTTWQRFTTVTTTPPAAGTTLTAFFYVVGTGTGLAGDMIHVWRAGAYAGDVPDDDIETGAALASDAGLFSVMTRVTGSTPVAHVVDGDLDQAGESIELEVEEAD